MDKKEINKLKEDNLLWKGISIIFIAEFIILFIIGCVLINGLKEKNNDLESQVKRCPIEIRCIAVDRIVERTYDLENNLMAGRGYIVNVSIFDCKELNYWEKEIK
jgi:hypothetical protein